MTLPFSSTSACGSSIYYTNVDMRAYLTSVLRFVSGIFARSSTADTVPRMSSSYTCTVSTEPGKGPVDAKAHHVKDKDGRLVSFVNPHPSFGIFGKMSFLQGVSMVIRNRFAGKLPVPDTSNAKTPDVVKPTFAPSRREISSLRTTWLGHASYLVEFPSGFRALFDPVFEDQFRAFGPKRLTPPACKPSDLPEIDAVFISHNHHDHLSYPTVKELASRFPSLHFFVGYGMAKWFRESGINSVTEMDWWDDAEVVLSKVQGSAGQQVPEQIKASVSCLPSQHGSLRTGFDYGHTVWASWSVKSGGKSAWFAGDTGYRAVPEDMEELGPGFDKLPRNPQFSQIGDLRGPFDVGLIPIGAYHPRLMYSGVHASPIDAVDIFQDTKCNKALAMHWGTWVLTSEPADEPPKKLKEALNVRGLPESGVFDVCAVGQSCEF